MILDNNAQATNIQAVISWWNRLSPSAPLKEIEALIEDLSDLIDGRPMEPYMDRRILRWFSIERGIEIAGSDEAVSKLQKLYSLTVGQGWFPVYNINAGTVAQKFPIEEYVQTRFPGFQFSSLVVPATERVFAVA